MKKFIKKAIFVVLFISLFALLLVCAFIALTAKIISVLLKIVAIPFEAVWTTAVGFGRGFLESNKDKTKIVASVGHIEEQGKVN